MTPAVRLCRTCKRALPDDKFEWAGRWRRRVCAECRRGRRPDPITVPPARVTDDGRPVLRRSEAEGLLSCTAYARTSSADAAFGQACHDMFARYILACQAHRETTRYADLDAICAEAYLGTSRGADPNRYPEARLLLQTFAENHTADLDTLMGVETTLVADMGWAVFDGTVDRLDRIDGGDPDDDPTEIRVTDYKTSWASASLRRTATQEVEDHSFQMRFYAALACLRWPTVREVTARVDYVRHGANGVLDVLYDRDDLLVWMDHITAAVQTRWGVGRRIPTGGAACVYCAHRATCAETALPWSRAPATEAEALTAVDAVIRYEAALGETRTGLREWFRRRDPIEVNGLVVGYMRSASPSWKASDPLGIVGELNARGLDGSKALFTAVDASAVPRYLHGELVEAGVARWDQGEPSFRMRKARPVPLKKEARP